jgi:hypothetical protein
MGVTFLATPMPAPAARVRTEATAATTGPVAATAIETKGETVEHRFINLNTGG